MSGWKSVARVAGISLVGAGMLWLLTFGSFRQEIRHGLPGGHPMPTFRLAELNAGLFEGDTTFVASTELEGKVVLLSFWATWCKPCEAEQPSYLALQEAFGKDGLVVLGVLHGDRAKPALAWLEEKDRESFRTVVGTEAVARAAHVGGLPHTLLVGRDGVVAEVFAGYWEERDAYIKQRVKELLSADE